MPTREEDAGRAGVSPRAVAPRAPGAFPPVRLQLLLCLQLLLRLELLLCLQLSLCLELLLRFNLLLRLELSFRFELLLGFEPLRLELPLEFFDRRNGRRGLLRRGLLCRCF